MRRMQVGDLVRLKHPLRGVDVKPDDIGEVIFVEPHPPLMGPTYRISVRFPRSNMSGELASHFVLVKAASRGHG